MSDNLPFKYSPSVQLFAHLHLNETTSLPTEILLPLTHATNSLQGQIPETLAMSC